MNGAKRAIIVGCSSYLTPEIPDLLYAEADGIALYERLINPDVGGYEQPAVELLRSPNADPLRRAFERLLRTAQPDDRILLYFAGHGLRDEAGRMYLALRDTDPELVRATGISAQLVRELLDECRSKHICLIMDCCFSGAFTGVRSVGRLNRDEVQRGVETLGGQGTVILTSAQASQQAREREEYGHGVFTHYLLEGLDGAADGDADGVITPDELYRYIASQMDREVGHTQRPTFSGNLIGGTFPLALSKRRRSEAFTRVLDQANSLRERRLHMVALSSLEQFQPGSIVEQQTLDEIRATLQLEMRQFGMEFRRRVFDEAKADLLGGPVFHEILASLAKRPEQVFFDDTSDIRQSLLRNYFLGRIDPRGVQRYWPVEGKDHPRKAAVAPESAATQKSTALTSVEPSIAASSVCFSTRIREVLRIHRAPATALRRSALYLLLGLAAVAAWFLSPKPMFRPTFDPQALRVGILLKREWVPPESAKQTFRLLLEQLNPRVRSAGYQFKTDVETFATMDEIVQRLKAGQLELVGELSPYDIYLANKEAGAQPFISPKYLDSNVYNGVFLVSSHAACMSDRETCWDWLMHSLLERKGRLAYTDDSSTSGYWVPRGQILDFFETTPQRHAFGDVSLKVGADEFIETIACGGRNVLAGVIAEFRLARVSKEAVTCGSDAAGVVAVFKTPTIHNGAFAVRRELVHRPGLLSALQQSWENAIRAAGAGAPLKLESAWTSVELAHYDAEIRKFTRPDPIAEERNRREKLVLIASAFLILITSVAYVWVSRQRVRMVPALRQP